MWATVIMAWCPLLTFSPESLQVSPRWKIESPGDLALFLGVGMDFKIWVAPTGAYRNCLRQLYFKSKWRGIGYSFQLAITAPLYSITGYCIATAQSWSLGQPKQQMKYAATQTHLSCLMTLKTSPFLFHQRSLFYQQQRSIWICLSQAYLPGTEVNHDHEGGSSRVRPFHCTSVWLTPTIAPNVGNSSA
jgi:hypothetical protein